MICDAAKAGDLQQIRELVGRNAPVNASGAKRGPLHWAARTNHIEAVQVRLPTSRSRALADSSAFLHSCFWSSKLIPTPPTRNKTRP